MNDPQKLEEPSAPPVPLEKLPSQSVNVISESECVVCLDRRVREYLVFYIFFVETKEHVIYFLPRVVLNEIFLTAFFTCSCLKGKRAVKNGL